MQILNLINNHQVKFRHTIGYRLYDRKSITLNDQDESCKYWDDAYHFARLNIPGTDIQKCQEAACKDPEYAYYFAMDIPGADIEYCQEHACKNMEWAYYFARDVIGADIEYCQKHACKKPAFAYWFSYVPGANIEYCRKACEYDEYWLNLFDQMIAKKNEDSKSNQ